MVVDGVCVTPLNSSPLVSLWRSSSRWIPGRSARDKSLPRWLSPPCGWSPWTRDPPGTRSCAGPAEIRPGPGPAPAAAASPGCVLDSPPGRGSLCPAHRQIRPGDSPALRGKLRSQWCRAGETPADSFHPWRKERARRAETERARACTLIKAIWRWSSSN